MISYCFFVKIIVQINVFYYVLKPIDLSVFKLNAAEMFIF